MPELPEVQTVTDALAPFVTGKTIARTTIFQEALRKPIHAAFAPLVGLRIVATRRRAKWPALVTEQGCLWMHLGMTGVIRVLSPSDVLSVRTNPQVHDHALIEFTDGTGLLYTDPRRFGMIAWTAGAESEPPTTTLGPEPLNPSDFTLDTFAKGLKRTGKAVKPLIMEGKLVVGVGNIYASEALFRCGIHPDAPAKTLKPSQVAQLHQSIVAVLKQAVDAGGSTLRDYRKPDGSTGDAQLLHHVYDRAGLACHTCSTPIKTTYHAQRATFWCPKCQPWKTHYVTG